MGNRGTVLQGRAHRGAPRHRSRLLAHGGGCARGRLRDCTVHHSRDRRGALALADGLVTGCLAARADTLDEVCSPKMQWWSLLALADLFVINRPHTH